jgi:hypothetical protein
MVYFQTKITILGKFWMVLNWKELVYFRALWSVYGNLVYRMVIAYILVRFGIFPRFGIVLYEEKSGSTDSDRYLRFSCFCDCTFKFGLDSMQTHRLVPIIYNREQ